MPSSLPPSFSLTALSSALCHTTITLLPGPCLIHESTVTLLYCLETTPNSRWLQSKQNIKDFKHIPWVNGAWEMILFHFMEYRLTVEMYRSNFEGMYQHTMDYWRMITLSTASERWAFSNFWVFWWLERHTRGFGANLEFNKYIVNTIAWCVLIGGWSLLFTTKHPRFYDSIMDYQRIIVLRNALGIFGL